MRILQRNQLQRISINFFNKIGRSRVYSTNKVHDVGQPTAATHPHLLREGEITPGITADEYLSRRKRLLELLPSNSTAIISAAPVKMMTNVVPYTFRQDADYLFITGCQQPGGLAILSHDRGLSMFMPEASAHDVLWQGATAGVNEALNTFKADEAYPVSMVKKILPGIIKSSSQLFHNVNTASSIYTDLEAFQTAVRTKKVKDSSCITHEARWIKSEAELTLMRNSAAIASQALLKTMLHSKSFPHEGMLSAKVEYECKIRGAQRMAFNPVVGGGPNGSVIHYSRNDQKIDDNDLVLMDVGCEFHGYLSDLTRTWPPSGKFSTVHEELYELILETNKESIKLCRPGVSIREIHNYSADKMRKGFKEFGLLKDDKFQNYHLLNPTNIGHYLGMDVHDCCTISCNRPLEPGVVITIEPGVYIPANPGYPERYQGIGIRIEDEVLISESGCEVLTGSLPKDVKQIESLLNNFSHAFEGETSSMAGAGSY
ncbi:OLC1v1002090C1 [Oldenlandia corymbosa var. corymbosa]|uniref:OLC1v1002090C1 n=1 Tax=Oldenlandia corymbosa var. corymbosa TaxID=529605 RepID=A0AAV1D6T0_OLDCO|nr:OLC1v1002090C1 [Oldenlandia corymbosa var. corymbosa]